MGFVTIVFRVSLETRTNEEKWATMEDVLFPSPIVYEPQIAMHKITRQEFELTALNQDDQRDPEQVEMFWRHIETLRKLAGIKQLAKLVDCYQEYNQI